MAQASPANRKAALPPHWPRTEHVFWSNVFFPKLPTELWLMIDENLRPIDRQALRMSSKFCRSMLETLPPLDSAKDRLRLACLSERDWLQASTFQRCVICIEPHERLWAQPHHPPQEFKYATSNHALCKGGIRMTADVILCQCCWTFLMLHKDTFGMTDGYFCDFQNYQDNWQHYWKTDWRGGRLLLEIKSTLSLASLGAMANWIIKYWKAPQVMRLMGRVAFCGCKGAHDILQDHMRRKLEMYLSSRPSGWRKRWQISKRSCFDCAWCGALYTVNGIDDKLIVTRYYDLSSAEAMAVSMHWDNWRPEWRAPRLWKDMGLCAWLRWRLSYSKTRIQSLYSVHKDLVMQ